MWNITHFKTQFTQKRSNLMFPSVLFLHHIWKNVHDSAYYSVLRKTFSQGSCYVNHCNDTEYKYARTHIFCQGNFLIYNRITCTKFPSFCTRNLQRESHKPYDPPNSVKWMQKLNKLTYIGTLAVLIAGQRCSTCTQLRPLSRVVASV
jgi:hypothetical protein